MRLLLSSALLILSGMTLAAYADDPPPAPVPPPPPAQSLSVQAGYRKCVPTGNGQIDCEIKLSSAVIAQIPMDGSTVTVPITADDQAFTGTISIAAGGASLAVGFSGNWSRTLSYFMASSFDLPAPLTVRDQAVMVVRDPLETDSYEPMMVVGPAPATK